MVATLVLTGEVESGEGLLKASYAQPHSTERWMLRRNLKRMLDGTGAVMSRQERYNNDMGGTHAGKTIHRRKYSQKT